TGCPLPKSGLTCGPENAVVVLAYGNNGVAKHSLTVALDLSITDGAEPALRRLRNSKPNRPVASLNDRQNIGPGNLGLLRKLACLPTGKPFKCANPQGAVVCNQQGGDPVAGKLFPTWRLPWHGTNAVEAKQAEFRAEPEISVRCLGNPANFPFSKSVADLPRRVRVLTDVEIGIQRETAWADEQNADQSYRQACNS